VIGAGLAGTEAAWQIASAGFPVVLHEMRPKKQTPAHKTGNFAELVCSNSLKSESINSAPWLLKQELRNGGSLALRAADATRVPGGQALTVDRDRFSQNITEALGNTRLVEIRNHEVSAVPQETVNSLKENSEWIAKRLSSVRK
jgi:methylenetetrahydrofolate--tRNA-(uracil-5-)-methyltransferase